MASAPWWATVISNVTRKTQALLSNELVQTSTAQEPLADLFNALATLLTSTEFAVVSPHPRGPHPLRTSIQRAKRALTVLSEVALFALRARAVERFTDAKTASKVRAALLADLFTRLGGLWPKVAQGLSQRPDVIESPDLLAELSRAQERCRARDVRQVRRIVSREAPLLDAHYDIEAPELAAGSIAQVHRATRRPDAPSSLPPTLAVKISFPHTRAQMHSDFDLLAHLADKGVLPELKDAWPCVKELKRSLLAEFDLEREAALTSIARPLVEAASRRQRHQLEGIKGMARASAAGISTADLAFDESVDVSFSVPEVFSHLSSPSVMAMEFVNGTSLESFLEANNLSLSAQKRLLQGASAVWGSLMLEDGLFQGDPHPGNMRVQGGPGHSLVVHLLDWGATEILPTSVRHQLCRLYGALAKFSAGLRLAGVRFRDLLDTVMRTGIIASKPPSPLTPPSTAPLPPSPSPQLCSNVSPRRTSASSWKPFTAKPRDMDATCEDGGERMVAKRGLRGRRGAMEGLVDEIATIMVDMGFRTRSNQPGVLFGLAFALFDTSLQTTGRSLFLEYAHLDPIQQIPRDYVFPLRVTSLLGGTFYRQGVDVSVVDQWEGSAREGLGRQWAAGDEHRHLRVV
ncbi:unnamed protein product [Vitrella brassicaformis CCMP3155]|uniref:ABC1 atypical kinase-like domain-containing protein n=2 Tax=Vitrella brassicaformis TaxID=1169539 RepID=A0A0G4EL32_VITBC|nr:unnamed protein product [Vitrella brassicaformis CCMP3155]|eukprot:CEL97662.1 unnamed protein product [Vitrella brassicaformis CCMP3155]